jgi:hypothetical protein
MLSYTDYEKEHLESLREQGLFVRIVEEGQYNYSVKVECSIYITDVDEETMTTNLLEVYQGEEHRDEEGYCIACKALDGEARTPVRGSVECPLCGEATAAWTLRRRRYCGVFLMLGPRPAFLFEAAPEDGLRPMPATMGRMIGERLAGLEAYLQGTGHPQEVSEADYDEQPDEDEIPPINFDDFQQPLWSPLEEEDRAAEYAEDHAYQMGHSAPVEEVI